jgi:hypothetical protein
MNRNLYNINVLKLMSSHFTSTWVHHRNYGRVRVADLFPLRNVCVIGFVTRETRRVPHVQHLTIQKLHGSSPGFVMTEVGTKYMVVDLGGILIN